MPAFAIGRFLGKFRGASLRFPLLLGVVLTVSALAFTGSGCRPYKKGEALYKTHCANCHMPDGTGLEGNIPPLAGSDYFLANPVATACNIRYGLQDTIRVNGRVYSPTWRIGDYQYYQLHWALLGEPRPLPVFGEG